MNGPLNESTWYPFTDQYVEQVPEAPGVYWLGENSGSTEISITYIGKVIADLKQRIKDHLTRTDRCISRATHFAYQRNWNPDAREMELLQDFRRRNGRLPRCNDRVG